jgi:hypothetical protein
VAREIRYTLIGFDSEDSARSASARVSQAIDELTRQMSHSLAGLDGVIISIDYDAGLQQLDRGYQTTGLLTPTNDEIASGIAMTPYVLRNGRVMSHMVLSAAVVPVPEPVRVLGTGSAAFELPRGGPVLRSRDRRRACARDLG